MKPFWVTFYSYKGGVGRSLAVANIATLLAKQGRRTVLVDFDLEAPGLDSFAEFGQAAGKPGVVEYVSEFLRCKVAPDIREFVHECSLPGPLRGQLWVMPAGRKDAAYNRQLARIDWVELYDSGFGTPFFSNWKIAFERQFQPDYVFVDSRTGLTEMGGVCVTQFPDLVVMLLGLNEQHLHGTAAVARSIREAEQDTLPQIHFVASPVPHVIPEQDYFLEGRRVRERYSLAERFEAAVKHLGTTISSKISYYAPACLNEKLFVLENDSLPITGDYKRLCNKITEFNRTGLDFLIKQADEALAERDFTRLERFTTVLGRNFSNRPESVYLNARVALAKNDLEHAIENAWEAFRLDPRYDEPFTFLVNHFNRAGELDRVAGLYDFLIGQPGLLSPGRLAYLQIEQAHILMALGRYKEAEVYYRERLNSATNTGAPPDTLLQYSFNATEASRRANGALAHQQWNEIVRLFEKGGSLGNIPRSVQANRWQAMHIAFAGIGDMTRAREALEKARRAAEALGEIEDIFSVKSYREIPVAEFLTINKEMLAALDRGELWDGMKLPPEGRN